MKRYQFTLVIFKWKQKLVNRVIEFQADTQEDADTQAYNYALGQFDAYRDLQEAIGYKCVSIGFSIPEEATA